PVSDWIIRVIAKPPSGGFVVSAGAKLRPVGSDLSKPVATEPVVCAVTRGRHVQFRAATRTAAFRQRRAYAQQSAPGTDLSPAAAERCRSRRSLRAVVRQPFMAGAVARQCL